MFRIEDIEDSEEDDSVRFVPLNDALKSALDLTERRRNLDLSGLPYREYLLTPHWRVTRERALIRAGYQCKWCESKAALQVHHLTYERLGNEAKWDLVVLCRDCHASEHGL